MSTESPNSVANRWGIWVRWLLGVIFVVPAAALAFYQFVEHQEPQLLNVGASHVEPGDQIGLSGRNLETVTGVTLLNGSGQEHPVAFRRDKSGTITATVDRGLKPGDYSIQLLVDEHRYQTKHKVKVADVSAARDTETSVKPPVRTTILEPSDGATVSISTRIKGTVESGVVLEGRHLWLVIQHGRSVWPQQEIFPNRDGAWGATGTFGGDQSSGEKYVVQLVDTSSSIHEQFKEWFKNGERTNKWPGVDVLKLASVGFNTLADISVTRE